MSNTGRKGSRPRVPARFVEHARPEAAIYDDLRRQLTELLQKAERRLIEGPMETPIEN